MSDPSGAQGGASRSQPLDLNELAQGYRVELKTESSLEQESRLRREEIELKHKLDGQRDEAKQRQRVFWAVFVLLLIIAVACGWIILFQNDASVETQTFARSAISAILAGLVGYFSGSAGKTPSVPPPK